MRSRVLSIASLAIVFVSIAPAAYAKGPLGATIEGDGIDGSIVIDQPGELGQGTVMSRFVEAVGFFDLTFGDSPRVAAKQPAESLGKTRVTITWDMGQGSTIVQDLYLHATGGPVTHVAPGQEFWEEGWATEGGWLVVTGDLASEMIAFGVDGAAVAHLAQTDVTEMANPVTAAEPTANGEDIDSTKAVATSNAEPAVQRGSTKTASGAEASSPVSAVAAEVASTAPGEPANTMLPLTLALLLAGGLIGVGTWIRRRDAVR